MPHESNDYTDDAPLTASKRSSAPHDLTEALIQGEGSHITGRSVTINRPTPELYAYWRDFPNLATFMENVVSIVPVDPKTTHWTVKAPGGRTVEWDAVVTGEAQDSYIEWASAPGADIENSGRVEFKPVEGRGTVVTATIAYDPPAGVIGKVIAKMFQREPAIQARRDLRRFKQLMETGEIATAAWTHEQQQDDERK